MGKLVEMREGKQRDGLLALAAWLLGKPDAVFEDGSWAKLL